MSQHKVTLHATEGIFQGLSRQNLLFHQCIGELVDNAIAAAEKDKPFKVEVILQKGQDGTTTDVYLVDNCKGMQLPILAAALQLGQSATTESRLNEHGFGMKNALATLSGGNGYWKLWTKPFGSEAVLTADGPFKPEMYMRDDETFPEADFLPIDISTLIKVAVSPSFVQTVQGRGAPATDLNTLRWWLIEHLGVMYRGYLEQDRNSGVPSGTIIVSVGTDRLQVPAIHVPLGNLKREYIDIEIGGAVQRVAYEYGTLDGVRRDSLVKGRKALFYYQGNQPTQGIDIRLGKRVIATRQFETIWKTEDGKSQLSRHNRYNDFTGELIIPELPRGVLQTTNNKTDFNLDDPEWSKLFDKVNSIRPPKDIREKSEGELRDKWIRMLKATNPDDTVTGESSIWPTGTKIDVYRSTPEGKVIIYELKVGKAAPQHLYQLKMYWDGLVLGSPGEQPREAILLVEDFDLKIEEMANIMNQHLVPPKQGKPYNFKIEKHQDKGL